MNFDALGYFSGSLQGFPQAQEVFVSDDGVSWTLVSSASYDALAMAREGKTLSSVGTSAADPWQSNKAKVSALFSMSGVTGKYIRIGVIIGKGDPTTLTSQDIQDINTRELVVYGSEAK